MAKQRTVIDVPDYPPALLKPQHAYSGDRAARDCIELLGLHYGLNSLSGQFHDPSLAPEERAKRWMNLALRLARDLVPAFRPGVRKDRKRDTDFPDDWIAAGGSVIPGFGKNPRTFYQAQFVEAIAAKQVEMGQSRAWVFKWFANEVATTTPAKARERLESLPRRYRNRTKSGSLKEAFMSIPLEVRQNPRAYLPQRIAPGYVPPSIFGHFDPPKTLLGG